MSGIKSICFAAAIGSAMVTTSLGQTLPGLDGALPPVPEIPDLPPVPGLEAYTPPKPDAPETPEEPEEEPEVPEDVPEPEEGPEIMEEEDIEEPAEAPAGAMTDETALEEAGFTVYKNQDYAGNQVPPPSISINDIGDGSVVASAVECAEECAATPGCNSLSYYGDLPEAEWPGKMNCYVKSMAACDMPADAQPFTDDRYFMIKKDCVPGAAGPTAATPEAALGTAPLGGLDEAPLGAPPLLGAAPPLGAADPLVGAPVAAAPRAFDADQPLSTGAPAPSTLGSSTGAPLAAPAATPIPDASAATFLAGAWISAAAVIAAYLAM